MLKNTIKKHLISKQVREYRINKKTMKDLIKWFKDLLYFAFMLVVYCTVPVTLMYIVVHFLIKYW
jgi:predicted transcriptional regulator